MKRQNKFLSFNAFKFKSTSGSKYTREKLDHKGTGELIMFYRNYSSSFLISEENLCSFKVIDFKVRFK